MTQEKAGLLPIWIDSDEPTTDNLAFGFDGYADALSGLIANRENGTPLVMGILGPWGAGKTSLLRAIKARLDSDTILGDPMRYRRCKTVWFQAWKYNHRQEPFCAFVEAVFKSMAADGFFSLARTRIDTVTRRFDKSGIYAFVSKLVTGVDISEFFSEPDFAQKVSSFETFQKFFDDLIWTFLNWRFKFSGQEKPDDKAGAMVIFIDDLDRCPPQRIVELLETIRLSMDRSGCIFVVGAGMKILLRALSGKYGQHDARRLMEKIFQVHFSIPQVPPEAFNRLIEETKIDKSHAQALKASLPRIIPALDHNPRQLKRFVNSINLLDGLLHGANVHIGFNKVLAWGLMVHLFSDLAAEIDENPECLSILRTHIQKLTDTFDGMPVCKLSSEQLKAENVPEPFHAYIQHCHLSEIIMALDVSPEELQWLRLLGRSVLATHK